MRQEVTDRFGNTVYLTDERWEHIVERHPELEGLREEILSTVRSGKRRQDAMALETFYYKKAFPRLAGRLTAIEVVAVFQWQINQPNNFILTAYPA